MINLNEYLDIYEQMEEVYPELTSYQMALIASRLLSKKANAENN